MDDVPDQAKGPEPDGQDEERSDRPDSSENVEQVLQLPRELPPHNVNLAGSRSCINEPCLLLVAKGIGKNWRELAIVLGLRNSKLDQISMDYPYSIDRSFRVLIVWNEEYQGIMPMQEELIRALKKVGRCDIADDVEAIMSEQCKDPHAKPSRNFNERQRGSCVPGEENIEDSLRGFYYSTKDLRDSERLGKSKRLPNFVAEYVDASGGFLDIPKYDVTLMIPTGAIETGMVQEVYLHVGPKTKYLIPEAPTRGPLFGQLVTFGPPGLNFKRRLILHIPLTSEKSVEKSHLPTTDWSNIASDKRNDIIVDQRQIIMVLSNFPRHCQLELKNITVCVTTPLFNPSEECKIQFCVKLWDELRNPHQKGSDEEVKNIEVNLESGDLDLNMTDLHYHVKSESGDGVSTGQDKPPDDPPPDDPPSDDEHQKEESNSERDQPDLSPDMTEWRDQPDLSPDMTEWTNDDVRKWLLYIGIPGADVSKFVTAQTDGDDLATYSASGLEKDFSFSKNLRELILNSRNSWLDKARARSRGCSSQQSGFVSTGSSHMAETEVICNDFLIEPGTSTIHLNDETDKQSTTIDLSVSVDVIKIPGGELSQRAVQLIINDVMQAVQEDSFCDLVTTIGNVFNENYAELVSLEGLTCVVRFHTKDGLYTFEEKCASGELAAKLSKILITDKVRKDVGSDLDLRLTLTVGDYVREMKHFEESV